MLELAQIEMGAPEINKEHTLTVYMVRDQNLLKDWQNEQCFSITFHSPYEQQPGAAPVWQAFNPSEPPKCEVSLREAAC